jgi:hypothetical protein
MPRGGRPADSYFTSHRDAPEAWPEVRSHDLGRRQAADDHLPDRSSWIAQIDFRSSRSKRRKEYFSRGTNQRDW